ncbi:hypothetical protein N0V87_008439 [Didymella glomerata]|jgi:hypothetical protein|uniref:Uncharacterized protein n=1 Tax=Didymella glomerata TaxID=749621 RepID=A0A9W8WT23_9PLEO|nr:hypothetical protein N0V87_008439 [Didymella glomerata]
MKLAAAITTLSLLALASGKPIASPALGDGTVNVARGDHCTNDATFELVDESSHFSVGKRAVPIEHMDDPAVDKAVSNDEARKLWIRAVLGAMDTDDGELVRRLAHHSGVQQCDKVNCPT